MSRHTLHRTALRLATVVVASLPVTGCEAPRAAEPPRAMDSPSAAEPVGVATPSPSPCVKIAFLLDQTGSRNSTRTELLTAADLEIAIDLLRDTCGEILVGAIRDKSNEAFLRIVVGPAPRKPRRPRDDGNVFDVQEAMAAYENGLATHDREMQQWRTDVDARVGAFTDRVDALVGETSLANSSAVLEAVFRADVALAEPEITSTRSSEGRRYIVLASDAQDTTRTRVRPLRSGAALVVANGAGTLGSLAAVPGVKGFEGLPAAVTWITELERANVH